MVQAKTDSCSAVPPRKDFDADPNRTDETDAERIEIWCSNIDKWVENPPSMIHAYYDEWYLTGLNVQRNLGLETAVVYQDPAFAATQPGYTADGFHDDNLWTLAQGLDISFLTGRSGDNVNPRPHDQRSPGPLG